MPHWNVIPRRAAPPSRTLLSVLGAVLIAACAGQNAALYQPTPEDLAVQAPDSFLVDIETSEGTITVKMRRHWSPLAVDRVWHLMDNNYYAGARSTGWWTASSRSGGTPASRRVIPPGGPTGR